MNREEMLKIWQQKRIHYEISLDFSDKVMNQVKEYESRKSKTTINLYRLIEVVSTNPAATAAVMALGAIAGVTRIAIIVLSLLAY